MSTLSQITYLVTGAAGFIGSNLVRSLLANVNDIEIVALDALTYSGHLASLEDLLPDPRLHFVHADIRDHAALHDVFSTCDISGVFHLAAESHVDRSIDVPMDFVTTNVLGTANLLMIAEQAWRGDDSRRFLHVSTDEVFGSLGSTGQFCETSPYEPHSPYAASKAASDHFVRAWAETYGLNVVVTNCTNNYGPYQFPEKLIPLAIDRLRKREPIPVYGDGNNVRDWLHVEDHCRALLRAFQQGRPGETYCIGAETEMTNIELIRELCNVYDDLTGKEAGRSQELIRFVTDRPGHDFRYAMNIGKASDELDWAPAVPLDSGLRSTVGWYLANTAWIDAVANPDHDAFQKRWHER